MCQTTHPPRALLSENVLTVDTSFAFQAILFHLPVLRPPFVHGFAACYHRMGAVYALVQRQGEKPSAQVERQCSSQPGHAIDCEGGVTDMGTHQHRHTPRSCRRLAVVRLRCRPVPTANQSFPSRGMDTMKNGVGAHFRCRLYTAIRYKYTAYSLWLNGLVVAAGTHRHQRTQRSCRRNPVRKVTPSTCSDSRRDLPYAWSGCH